MLGNHDAWCLAGTNLVLPDATPRARLLPSEIAMLSGLPRTRTVRPGVLLCHGLGNDFLARLDRDDQALEGGWRLVLNGHSHRPLNRRVGSTYYLGAGALGTDRGLVLVDPETLEWTAWSVKDGAVGPSTTHS